MIREEIKELENVIALRSDAIRNYIKEIDGYRKEIASLKDLIIQATPYVEYAARYSTPLSQKLSEEWLEKTQARREK